MKKQKSETVMWCLSEFSLEHFKMGWDAWTKFVDSKWHDKGKNPFKPKTNEWYSWNKGYNLNDKGLKIYD